MFNSAPIWFALIVLVKLQQVNEFIVRQTTTLYKLAETIHMPIKYIMEAEMHAEWDHLNVLADIITERETKQNLSFFSLSH